MRINSNVTHNDDSRAKKDDKNTPNSKNKTQITNHTQQYDNGNIHIQNNISGGTFKNLNLGILNKTILNIKTTHGDITSIHKKDN